MLKKVKLGHGALAEKTVEHSTVEHRATEDRTLKHRNGTLQQYTIEY